MKRLILGVLVLCLVFTVNAFAQDNKTKIILLITEQNIEGPQRAWWASEIDLSKTETIIARKLMEQNFEIIEPSNVGDILKLDKAFRRVGLADPEAIKLANLSKADYVLLGKALASSGGRVPQSRSLISCFANLSAKLIRVKDSKVIAYIDETGSSAHMDKISGGAEALAKAANLAALNVVDIVAKDKQQAEAKPIGAQPAATQAAPVAANSTETKPAETNLAPTATEAGKVIK